MKTRIAIAGIGGIGGYFGARLENRYGADNNVEIIFIQRGMHLEAMRENGLQLITDNNIYYAKPDVITDNPKKLGIFTHIIFCTKCYQLESMANLLKDNVDENSLIFSTLNGIDIDKRIKEILPKSRVIPGCIYVNSHIEEPGLVRQNGSSGGYYFGVLDDNMDGLEEFDRLLNAAKIKAKCIKNIQRKIWEKYLLVCALASTTSLFKIPIGRVLQISDALLLFKDLIAEIIEIARKCGVVFSKNIIDELIHRISMVPFYTKTSMQLDLERKKQTEIDIFAKWVVNNGRVLGIHVPKHERVLKDIGV